MKGVRNQGDRGLSCSDPGQGPEGGLADTFTTGRGSMVTAVRAARQTWHS